MDTIIPRNMYDIRRFKNLIICITALCLTTIVSSYAQYESKYNSNYRDFQHKNYYFGISPGSCISNFKLTRSSKFTANDSIRTVASVAKPGFTIHLISNIKIGDYFDFRFVPGFAFMYRELNYDTGERNYAKQIESVNLEIPMLIRFKSEPFHDKRVFVVGGVKYSYDVASNSKVRRENAQELVQISPHDFSIEVGAGVQFFFPYFIFSPEIKISHGIGNIHIFKDNLLESSILDKILSRTIQISFHLEG